MLFELELEVMQVNQTSFSRDWQQIRTEKSLQTFIKHSNLCTFRCLYLVLAKWDLFSNTFWIIVTNFHSPRVAELMESLKLGNVWVFVQLIHRPTTTKNQLYKNQNIA